MIRANVQDNVARCCSAHRNSVMRAVIHFICTDHIPVRANVPVVLRQFVESRSRVQLPSRACQRCRVLPRLHFPVTFQNLLVMNMHRLVCKVSPPIRVRLKTRTAGSRAHATSSAKSINVYPSIQLATAKIPL